MYMYLNYALILYQKIEIKAVYVKSHYHERSTKCTSSLRMVTLKLFFIIFTTQLFYCTIHHNYVIRA